MRQEIGDDIGDLQKDKVHMKHGELEKWKSDFHSIDPFCRIPRLVDYVFFSKSSNFKSSSADPKDALSHEAQLLPTITLTPSALTNNLWQFTDNNGWSSRWHGKGISEHLEYFSTLNPGSTVLSDVNNVPEQERRTHCNHPLKLLLAFLSPFGRRPTTGSGWVKRATWPI